MIIEGLKTFYAPAERLDMEKIKKQSQKINTSGPILKHLTLLMFS